MCVDHLHFKKIQRFHIINAVSRDSKGDAVDTTSVTYTIALFETLWITPFGDPESILFDTAFENSEITDFVEAHVINNRPTAPRGYKKSFFGFKA